MTREQTDELQKDGSPKLTEAGKFLTGFLTGFVIGVILVILIVLI